MHFNNYFLEIIFTPVRFCFSNILASELIKMGLLLFDKLENMPPAGGLNYINSREGLNYRKN